MSLMCSVNEIEVLGAKAARGAGAYPAQAVHFGRALVWHLVAGRSVEDIATALKMLPGGVIQTLPFCGQVSPLGQSYADARVGGDLPIRIECPAPLHVLLSEFAARVLVPESAQSRSAGAGAGLTDND